MIIFIAYSIKKKKRKKEKRLYFLITTTQFSQSNKHWYHFCKLRETERISIPQHHIKYYPIIINPHNQLSSLEQTKKNLLNSLPSFPRFHSINFSPHVSRERERDHWKNIETREAWKAKKSEKGRNTLRKRRPQAFTFQRGENSSATKSERVAFFLRRLEFNKSGCNPQIYSRNQEFRPGLGSFRSWESRKFRSRAFDE